MDIVIELIEKSPLNKILITSVYEKLCIFLHDCDAQNDPQKAIIWSMVSVELLFKFLNLLLPFIFHFNNIAPD